MNAADDQPIPSTTYVSLSYRYLRLSMAAMIAFLLASILWEFQATGFACLQDSISAYYFTPVQLVFVGSWIALGICMIVLKGSNEWEDAFLNAAGLLAPVVALVPTPRTGDCSSVSPMNTSISVQNVNNNLLAYFTVGVVVLAGSWIALGLAVPSTRRRWPWPRRPWPLNFRYALLPISVLFVVGFIFFVAFRASFINLAHPIATSLLTALIIATVFQNSIQIGRGDGASRQSKGGGYFFNNGYAWIAWLMISCAVVAILVLWLLIDWKYWRLAIEGVEILLFLTFWIWQTFDEQKSSLPPLDRAERPTPAAKKEWRADPTHKQ